MALFTGIALAGLALSAVSTGAAIIQQREATSEAKKAERLQQQQNQENARRERLQTIAQGRRRRAAAANSATIAGAAGTGSSTFGGIDAVTGQANAQVGFINTSENITRGISSANQRTADAIGNAQLFQLGTSLGAGISNNARTLSDGFELFKSSGGVNE